ncbi:hypothetical protein [Aeromonas media]|uniref:hypothetical protein n=1 Tax=Aeromonas media TaxID=651 RepID=UPI003D1A1F9A
MIKTHELITTLDYISKIMSYYPNKTVDYALDDILLLLERKSHQELKNKTKANHKRIIPNEMVSFSVTKDIFEDERIKNLIDDVEYKDITEIENLLTDIELFPSIASIRTFATHLGFKISARQNKTSLIKTILKSIERSRIDRTIGNRTS